jgi:FixJ family two-component response regulator
MTETTVFVVDDDEAVRGALALLLRSVGLKAMSFDSGNAFLGALMPEWTGCVVLDIRMPGMSGLELHEKLVERGYSLPIIFITGHGDIAMAVRAMKSGAFDFIEKPFNDQDLLDRIHRALSIEADLRTRNQLRGEVQERFQQLTPREREIMSRIVDGQANKVIAIELGLSERTVELHRAHVMEKMRASSVAELVRLALLADAEAGAS